MERGRVGLRVHERLVCVCVFNRVTVKQRYCGL